VTQFECGTRILRVIHGRDARATLSNCITTQDVKRFCRTCHSVWKRWLFLDWTLN